MEHPARVDQPGQEPGRTSRRTFLKGAAVAGAAGLAGPLLAASPSAVASTAIIYGANHDYYHDWVKNAPSPDHKNSERRYFDAVVPYDDPDGNKTGKHSALIKDWASMGCYTDYAIVSLRINPVYLLQKTQIEIPDNGSGFRTLDGQIKYLLRTMPAHAVLTNWQEAGPGNPLKFKSWVNNPTAIRELHNHMQGLVNDVRAEHGQVEYGQIVLADPATSGFDSWLGHDLDTYMVDIYDYSNGRFRNSNGTISKSKIYTRMTGYRKAFASATSKDPLIHITETNSPKNGNREDWFHYLTEWMSANNGYRIVSHWDPTGQDSGPWPPSKNVLNYFKYLQKNYGA